MEESMDKLIAAIGGSFLVIVLIAIAAVVSGTIIWLIWPVAIPAAFPGLVSSGILAAKLAWWESVCLSWLFGLLIKASQNNTTKKDD